VKYVGLWNAQLASPQVYGILSPFLDVIIQQVPAELHYTKKNRKNYDEEYETSFCLLKLIQY